MWNSITEKESNISLVNAYGRHLLIKLQTKYSSSATVKDHSYNGEIVSRVYHLENPTDELSLSIRLDTTSVSTFCDLAFIYFLFFKKCISVFFSGSRTLFIGPTNLIFHQKFHLK